MKLTEVVSSHVQAVGFIPEIEVLLVLFKDGTVAARPGVAVERYLALLESASKGSFLAAMAEKSVCIRKGGPNGAAGNAGNTGGTVATQPSVESPRRGRLPGAPALTLNDMMKVKGGEPPAGCDFAVVHRK